VAGAVGRVLILYRPHPERAKIVLPGAAPNARAQ
jgi:RNA-binding protein YhbY